MITSESDTGEETSEPLSTYVTKSSIDNLYINHGVSYNPMFLFIFVILEVPQLSPHFFCLLLTHMFVSY